MTKWIVAVVDPSLLCFVFFWIVVSSSDSTTSASSSIADPVFKLGDLTFFGSGCPSDTVRVVESSDRNTFSVLFSSYQAETSRLKTRHRVSCNLAVPVDVKQGVSIGLIKVDYRGNAFVGRSSGSYAKFSSEYFFSTLKGVQSSKEYRNGFDNDVRISHTTALEAVSWSPCGASSIFRINTAITAFKSSKDAEDTQIAIDSGDAVTNGQYFRYEFVSRAC